MKPMAQAKFVRTAARGGSAELKREEQGRTLVVCGSCKSKKCHKAEEVGREQAKVRVCACDGGAGAHRNPDVRLGERDDIVDLRRRVRKG